METVLPKISQRTAETATSGETTGLGVNLAKRTAIIGKLRKRKPVNVMTARMGGRPPALAGA